MPFIVLMFFPAITNAYLEPGLWSYMFHIIVASLIGVVYSLKVYWIGIKGFIRMKFKKKRKDKLICFDTSHQEATPNQDET